eukprot:gnl/TRDRNA2_/TRDRNA2_153650_c3_seq1.p1 gnl/TRDRNA2_/TRDRNA2_153650_c3~~gnl/TRDRNA2_/TRDRNA2_153650_c3_seq1.p1  ORF type:complete len:286 (-),score=66.33 gnl/TRDRNA2_/TRDRNA2_153650_c3_seq1:95-952(-)
MIQAMEREEDVLNRCRRVLNAVKFRSGKSMEEMFKAIDANNSGSLDFRELLFAVRNVLNVHQTTICDYDLKTLFTAMDKDGSGEVSLEELFEYLAKGPRRPEDEAAKMQQRIQRVRKNLRIAFGRLDKNEASIRRLFNALDVDGTGRLSEWEFEEFVRIDLKMSRWDIQSGDLKEFYFALDSDGDGIDVEELLAYIRKKDTKDDYNGQFSFCILTPGPKVQKKRKTYLQQLVEENNRIAGSSRTSPTMSSSHGKLPTLSRPTSMPELRYTPSFVNTGRTRPAIVR